MSSYRVMTSRRWILVAGITVVTIGALALLGWIAGIKELTRILPGMATMKFNTAICFVFSGTALLLLRPDPSKYSVRQLSMLFAAAAGSLALLTLAQDVAGMSFGIDELLFNDDSSTSTRAHAPGRMSQGTSLCFAMAGAATVGLSMRRGAGVIAGQVLAVVVAGTGLLGLTGYTYGIEAFYAIGPFDSMALHTCAGFTVLGLGLLATHPHRFIAAPFSTQYAGGRLARELMPALVIVTFLFGLMYVWFVRAGWFEVEFGAAVLIVSVLTLMIVLVGIYSAIITNVNDQRTKALDAEYEARLALEWHAQELESRVAERTRELRIKTIRLQELAAELNQAEHKERRRISYILHENIQQILIAANMTLSQFISERDNEMIMKCQTYIEEAFTASKDLAVQLHPPVLYTHGFTAALEWLCRRMDGLFGLRVGLSGDLADELIDDQTRSFLFQSVRELLTNVVKHAESDRAEIELSQEGRFAIIRVSNEDQPKTTPQLKRQAEYEIGFGLSNIQQRLDVMGGTCVITHERGFAVTMMLPIDHASAANGGTEPETNPNESDLLSPTRLKPLNILIVEDHSSLRELFVLELNRHDDLTVVGEAVDGEQVVMLADRLKPDLILMDVSLPKLNGIEATRRICQGQPNSVVIGLSMHEDPQTQQSMLTAGAAAYLTKDTPLNLIVEKIRSYASEA